MSTPLREQTHLWQAPALGDVEMLHARYFQQRFAPHVHEGYVFTVIESGAQRFWHRGSEHLAPASDSWCNWLKASARAGSWITLSLKLGMPWRPSSSSSSTPVTRSCSG